MSMTIAAGQLAKVPANLFGRRRPRVDIETRFFECTGMSRGRLHVLANQSENRPRASHHDKRTLKQKGRITLQTAFMTRATELAIDNVRPAAAAPFAAVIVKEIASSRTRDQPGHVDQRSFRAR